MGRHRGGPMSGIIERVAQAICLAQSWMLPWDEIPAEAQDRMRNVARAAIQAMREPTEDELTSAVKEAVQVHGLHPDQQYYPTAGFVRIAFQSVIDAALSDKST